MTSTTGFRRHLFKVVIQITRTLGIYTAAVRSPVEATFLGRNIHTVKSTYNTTNGIFAGTSGLLRI